MLWEKSMNAFFQDVRLAWRLILRNPGLTLVIVLSLGLGIGATTAVFSVSSALLLRPLPYPQQDRLAILWLRSPGLGIPQDWPSPGQFHQIRAQNNVFDEMSLAIGGSVNLTGQAQAERVDAISTTSTLFDLLGAKTLLGRAFEPAADAPGKPKIAVLTYGFWQREFGADPQILGRSLTLNGDSYSIVGVLRPEFTLKDEVMPGVGSIKQAEIFLPLEKDAYDTNNYGDENYNILARLKPGVTMRAAQADVSLIAARIREEKHRDPTFTISVVPLLDQVVGSVRRSLLVLLGAVALVLLIACANVANLLLARAGVRQKEVAIRAALGAGWSRMVRQLLTESIVLGVLGGAAGLAIAAASLFAVRTINPGNIPRLAEISIDLRVLAFTAAVSILTGIIFGLAPALRITRVDLNSALKSGGRSSGGTGGLNLGHDKLRGLMVASELALSLMLLVGAGLLLRSFGRLLEVSPGFTATNLISTRVSAITPKYKDPDVRARLFADICDRVRNLPGVTAVGAATSLPLTGSVGWGGISVEGYVPPPNQPELQVDQRTATPDYFRAMQIPLVSGRAFAPSDNKDSQPVVVIDEKMATHFWPHGDPVGHRVGSGTNPKEPWFTIVGVVGVVKEYGLDTDTRMVVYFAQNQRPAYSMYLVARTASDPAALASAISQQVHALEPDAPVYDVSTMSDRLSQSLARQRFSMLMLGAFAAFAIILAAVGVYGVMSYLVTQGTRDIAIRIALGAQESNILGLVVRQGMTLALIGIAAGVVGAFALTRVMSALLFGVSVRDGVTFATVTAILAVVALVACYIPARRAIRVDPMVALRYE
jgi:predicted permease